MSSSVVIGTLPYYNFTYGNFNLFIERLELYFIINKVTGDEKQRAILLTSIDDETYTIFRDLVYPKLPKDKTYQELVDVVRQKISERKAVWRLRLEFNKAKQEENESIAEWIARLQRVAGDCKLGHEVDSYVINQFIAGIRNKNVQERFFKESHEQFTLVRAIEIATATENEINKT